MLKEQRFNNLKRILRYILRNRYLLLRPASFQKKIKNKKEKKET